MKKEHIWLALVVAAAVVAVAFFYFKSKKKPAEEKKEEITNGKNPPSSGGGAGSFTAGDVSALVSDAVASIVPQTYVPLNVVRPVYREIVARRFSQPVCNAAQVVRPAAGSGTVTTPAGNTAVIAPNPNAPRFN